MTLVLRSRIGKKRALYLPKRVMEELGLREGDKVLLIVRRGELVVKPVFDPFELALKAPKFASTTVEEFERESEEAQHEFFEDRATTCCYILPPRHLESKRFRRYCR